MPPNTTQSHSLTRKHSTKVLCIYADNWYIRVSTFFHPVLPGKNSCRSTVPTAATPHRYSHGALCLLGAECRKGMVTTMIDRISTGQTTAGYTTSRATTRSSTASAQQKSGVVDTFEQTSKTGASDGTYAKTGKVKPDSETIAMLKQETERISENLRAYIHKLIVNQGSAKSISIDSATVNQARQAISEDGEWGVKAVSDRIVAFAVAISGDDPAKLATLKAAIEKGFAEAGKALGGALPDICTKTRDEVMKKLDAWANEE